jgi:hypothetical protein
VSEFCSLACCLSGLNRSHATRSYILLVTHSCISQMSGQHDSALCDTYSSGQRDNFSLAYNSFAHLKSLCIPQLTEVVRDCRTVRCWVNTYVGLKQRNTFQIGWFCISSSYNFICRSTASVIFSRNGMHWIIITLRFLWKYNHCSFPWTVRSHYTHTLAHINCFKILCAIIFRNNDEACPHVHNACTYFIKLCS